MYEALNNVGLNVVANCILFMFGLMYSAVSFQDYQREKSRQNLLFLDFEFCGTIYLFLYVVELLTTTLGAGRLFVFVLSFVRVFFAVLMYTAAGDYIVLLIEKAQHISKPIKVIVHLWLIVFFFIMPSIYWFSKNSLLTNLPIFSYLLLLEAVIIFYRQALSRKNMIILTLLIVPTL